MEKIEIVSLYPKALKRPALRKKHRMRQSTSSTLNSRVRAKSGRTKRPKGVSKLVKELDVIFSKYVRLSSADKDGIVSCYTCGHRNHWKKMQNGHYVSRFYKATRWDENNCRVQCAMCNLWKRGDLITFRQKLVVELKEGGVKYLEESRNVSEKLDPGQLAKKIAIYKVLIEELETGKPAFYRGVDNLPHKD